MKRSRFISLAKGCLTLGCVLLPRAIAACPACTGRNDATNWGTVTVLAMMMLVPFAVAIVVVRVVRRAESDSLN
jgi:hypothetical protein